jgi:hypothetical protein
MVHHHRQWMTTGQLGCTLPTWAIVLSGCLGLFLLLAWLQTPLGNKGRELQDDHLTLHLHKIVFKVVQIAQGDSSLALVVPCD